MRKILLPGLLLLAVHGQATAGPGYYLVSTYEDEGEKTVDYKYWSVKKPGAPTVSAPEIGVGYGVTKRWYTELYATWVHVEGNGTRYSDLTWQNDLLLTQGQYPYDLALHTNIRKFDDTNSGIGFEFGPVLQTEVGRTQFNANVFFERNYRAEFSNPMQMKYQWQVKYRWKPLLEFGLQGFGELGEWKHWAPRDQQSHRIGPAVFGTWHIDDAHELKYEAAWFTGSIYAAHAKTFSMRVQYGF